MTTWVSAGAPDEVLSDAALDDWVDRFLIDWQRRRPLRRLLLLPPDITRRASGLGALAGRLYHRWQKHTEVWLLPALGTHAPLSQTEAAEMFPGVPPERLLVHDWRRGVVPLGEVPAAVVRTLSEGCLEAAIPVAVSRHLFEGEWDLILSLSQLVPHEVAGIAGHSKNLFIGVGGSAFLHFSHWLSALWGIERTLGRVDTPVRRLLEYARRQCQGALPVVYLLTVRSRDAHGQLVTRGLFLGDDEDCFRAGAALCRQVNLTRLERAPQRIVVYLDPIEFKSTWLGNKAIYRTRLAIADGGELIILAPGVRTFGEDPVMDRLLRRVGYRGTPAVVQAVQQDAELASNLSAAAHLIHGSSEGRFRILYCPGALSREEVEQVGYAYGALQAYQRRYPPERLRDGWNRLPDGEEIFYVSPPGLGLWGVAHRLGET
jgi:nickel-dependent lactate racemase